jgi:hypothetical protein
MAVSGPYAPNVFVSVHLVVGYIVLVVLTPFEEQTSMSERSNEKSTNIFKSTRRSHVTIKPDRKFGGRPIKKGRSLLKYVKIGCWSAKRRARQGRRCDMAQEAASARDGHKQYRERKYYTYFKTMQTRWSDNDQYGQSYGIQINHQAMSTILATSTLPIWQRTIT